MNKKVKRIAIIGPESTGKSTLCEQLSNHYNEPWVKEYAREYLPLLQRKYTLEDVLNIYKKQFTIEQELISNSCNFIFTDTEFIIAKIWCNYIFNEVPLELEKMILNDPYDFYILTYPDLPWEDDPLREHPGKGTYFYEVYKKELDNYKFNYGIVRGTGNNRFEMAVQLIDALQKT